MTWKQFKKKIEIKKKFEKYYQDGFYTGSIGKLTQDKDPEIILLTYDQKLIVFSKDGNKVLDIPFSNDVCKIFVEDLFLTGEKVFISFAYSGEVRVFAESGEIFWRQNLEDIFDGFLGNLDYDQKKELVILQKPNKILVLNNEGQTVAKYTHPKHINFISHSKVNSKNKQIILIADKDEKLHALDVEDTISEIPYKGEAIIGLDSLSIIDKTIEVILDKKNFLNFIDKKGNLIDRFKVDREIDLFFTGHIYDETIESLIILTRDSYLMVYEISVADKSEYVDKDKKIIKPAENKDKMKDGVEQDQKNPSLEFDPNYYQKEPQIIENKSETPRTLEKTIKPKKTAENLEIRCPECRDFFTPTIIKRLMEGKTAFCEECGLEVHKSDFPTLK